MPILRGSVTFSRFRVEPIKDASPDWGRILTRSLRQRRFEPLDLDEVDERAQGFAELENPDATDFDKGSVFQGDFALFTYRIDEIRIPPAMVKQELERWAKAFEAEHQRPPGRREKADAKTEIRFRLRSRSPIRTRTCDVSWNLEGAHLLIWGGSRKLVDEVQDAIEQAVEVRLLPLAPVVTADLMDIPDKALAPTPRLTLPQGER